MELFLSKKSKQTQKTSEAKRSSKKRKISQVSTKVNPGQTHEQPKKYTVYPDHSILVSDESSDEDAEYDIAEILDVKGRG